MKVTSTQLYRRTTSSVVAKIDLSLAYFISRPSTISLPCPPSPNQEYMDKGKPTGHLELQGIGRLSSGEK